jgi:hypothetical protein
MNLKNQHSFWGSFSPLGGLTGMGLLIMASARFSWALTIACGLFWVYGLTVISYMLLSSAKVKIFPQEGRSLIFICLASFFGSIYLFLFWLLCPFAALEVFIQLLLIPLFCANSGLFRQITSMSENSHFDIFDYAAEGVSQASVLAGLLLMFSIIREPLAYCSLSFPGSYNGMITIFSYDAGSFLPIGIFSSSAGALLLLGYFICLYQYGRDAK